jgi:hypothetical protein
MLQFIAKESSASTTYSNEMLLLGNFLLIDTFKIVLTIRKRPSALLIYTPAQPI